MPIELAFLFFVLYLAVTLNVAVFCSFVCCREGFSLSPYLDKDEKWIFLFTFVHEHRTSL